MTLVYDHSMLPSMSRPVDFFTFVNSCLLESHLENQKTERRSEQMPSADVNDLALHQNEDVGLTKGG